MGALERVTKDFRQVGGSTEDGNVAGKRRYQRGRRVAGELFLVIDKSESERERGRHGNLISICKTVLKR